MKSISYIAGYTFGTAKSIVSRIPQPDVDKIKADFNQAIADQQAPKPKHVPLPEDWENTITIEELTALVNHLNSQAK